MKRVNLYNRIIWGFLLFNIAFHPVNEDFLEYLIPKDIMGYSYWLSIGIFIGFNLYNFEVKRKAK